VDITNKCFLDIASNITILTDRLVQSDQNSDMSIK